MVGKTAQLMVLKLKDLKMNSTYHWMLMYWNLQYHGYRHVIKQTLRNLMGLHWGSLADNITGYWHLHILFEDAKVRYVLFILIKHYMHWDNMKWHIKVNADKTSTESTINYSYLDGG